MPEASLRLALTHPVTVLSVSDGVASLLGCAPAALVGDARAWSALVHPDDADLIDRLLADVKEPEAGVFNLRLRQAGGRIRCVRARYRKVPGILDLVLQDAKALAVAAGDAAVLVNFQAMMENADDFIYFKDRNHVFTGASQTLVALTDPVEHWTDLIGKTDYDVFPEPYADLYYRLEKQLFGGAPAAREIQAMESKDGRRGWVDNRKYPIRNAEGEIVGLFGIARDITDKVLAEQSLRQERDATRNILETVEAIIVALDREGRITLINRKGCALLGRTEAELLGQDWFATCLPDRIDKARVREVFCQTLAGDLALWEYFENPVINSAGEERLIAWHNSAMRDKEGRVVGGLSAGEDITERKQAEVALRVGEERLRLALQAASQAWFDVDLTSGQVSVSEEYPGMIGYAPADFHTDLANWLAHVHPEDRAALEGVFRVCERDGGPHVMEYRRQSAKGDWVWLRSVGKIVQRDEAGRATRMIGIHTDITERRLAETRLSLAAKVFTHAREGIMITDADGVIIEVNEAFSLITGYGHDEAVGQTPRLLKSGRQPPEFYADMWRALTHDGHWSGELWNRRKSGELFATLQTISAMRDDNGNSQQYVSLFTDITTIKEHERQLQHIAHYDALTGMPNRVLLADRLHQAMAQAHRRGQKLALAYIDLDGFKAVNDLYGHAIGDQLLTLLAGRMKQSLREGDTLARMGGDEFVAVMLDLADAESTVPMLVRLLAAAAHPVLVGDIRLQVSASIGVSFYPQSDEVDADQLLRQGDQAMYQAKLAGKNRYHVFDADQDRSLRIHHESLECIRTALAERQFVLYYQPKVNMRSGAVIGAEALIRWRHPERGLLAPDAFLPVIEDHPLSIDLGEWVIDTALTQIALWQAQGVTLPISVNIAAHHLQQPNFVDRLRVLLAAHPDVPAAMLELEVLETTALADLAQAAAVLDACRALGVRSALDDFGTGYSSLTYLKRLDVAQLKIDRSFIRDMLDDPDDLAILEGVLGLATVFRRQVIAEGVETIGHGLMLLRMGCELAQGYGIARPMPACEMPAWLAGWCPDSCWRAAKAVKSDDLALLYASIDHRIWVAGVEAYLRGEREQPPVLDPALCRLHWRLGDEGVRQGSAKPILDTIEILHRHIHGLANELCVLKAHGRAGEALNRLTELHGQRDILLDLLQGPIQ